jgi:Lamin Tail Domain
MSFRIVAQVLVISAMFALPGAVNASTVAITEFEYNPVSTDEDSPEWIELFNYGKVPVDIGGWTLKDNATSIYEFPTGFTIPSGEYAIAARDRAAFVLKWLGGVDDARVAAGNTPFVMNNSSPGDGLYLRNGDGDLIWSLGYNIGTADATAVSIGRATFLTIDDFSVTNYGEPPQHGPAHIIRSGLDGTGTLGYEDNNQTADPFMYSVLPVNTTAQTLSWGSPLLGGYTVIPEPGTITLLIGIAAGLLSFRRGR